MIAELFTNNALNLVIIFGSCAGDAANLLI